MEACRLYSKFSARPSNLEAIPSVVEKVVNHSIVVFRQCLHFCLVAKWEMQTVYVCLFCPKAVRCSMYGRPGACYIDIAGDMVNAKVDRKKVRLDDYFFFLLHGICMVLLLTKVCLCSREVSCCPSPPLSAADSRAITDAVSVLTAAKRPLIIIGKGDKNLPWNTKVHVKMHLWFSWIIVRRQWKLHWPTGAAYARAESGLREFVEMSGLPFLPTPMGKGVLPDDHPNCVAAARSRSVSQHKVTTRVWNLMSIYCFIPRLLSFLYFKQGSSSSWCNSTDWSSTKLDSTFWSAS